jgi:hypothetical protein
MAALEAACTFGVFLFYRTIKRLFNPRRVATTLIGAPAIISLGFLLLAGPIGGVFAFGLALGAISPIGTKTALECCDVGQ